MNADAIQWLLIGITSLLFVIWVFTAQAQIAHPYRDRAPWASWVATFLPIFLIVLVVRTVVAEPSYIPSASMAPTLLPGDYIVIKKYAYGLRLPLSSKVISSGRKPQRGDVVVFYPPDRSKGYYVKRIVGLPGDQLDYSGGHLRINGQVGSYQTSNADPVHLGAGLPSSSQVIERLPGEEYSHEILLDINGAPKSFTVPSAQYFLMGDNRGNSEDSRVWGTVGYGNLVGTAVYVWLSKPPGGVLGIERNGAVY